MSEQCPICGADMMHVNPNLCKNFHDQIKARESRERQLAEIKQRDDAIRQDERDKIYKQIKNDVFTLICNHGNEWMVINLSDVDRLFSELRNGDPE
jgi:hypothetical protein